LFELRPGVYTVTFTLAGFSTVKLEGITLTAGFVAKFQRRAARWKTITVSAQSPPVDVQSTTRNRAITLAQIDALSLRDRGFRVQVDF
jgi:hypothetical protein